MLLVGRLIYIKWSLAAVNQTANCEQRRFLQFEAEQEDK